MPDHPFDASERASSLEPSAIACTHHKKLNVILCLCKLSMLSASYFELHCKNISWCNKLFCKKIIIFRNTHQPSPPYRDLSLPKEIYLQASLFKGSIYVFLSTLH